MAVAVVAMAAVVCCGVYSRTCDSSCGIMMTSSSSTCSSNIARGCSSRGGIARWTTNIRYDQLLTPFIAYRRARRKEVKGKFSWNFNKQLIYPDGTVASPIMYTSKKTQTPKQQKQHKNNKNIITVGVVRVSG